MNGILDWNLQNAVVNNNMMVDEDYMNFMSDTLFSTLTSNQPFAFPDTREIGKNNMFDSSNALFSVWSCVSLFVQILVCP